MLKFAALFDEMEKKSNELSIKTYGISNSSLQDIFFGLSDEARNLQEDHDSNDSVDEGNNGHVNRSKTLSLSSTSARHVSIAMQILILMKKRFTIQKRDRKGGFFLIILPVILISFVLLVLLIEVPLAGPPISLSLSLYDSSSSKFQKLYIRTCYSIVIFSKFCGCYYYYPHLFYSYLCFKYQ